MIAYDRVQLYNLLVVKETKRWFKSHFISDTQYEAIKAGYKTELYNPNIVIRVLLFVATTIAITGGSGLIGVMLQDALDSAWRLLLVLNGAFIFFVAERMFIKARHHYKSGVNEALIYAGALSVMFGISDMDDPSGMVVVSIIAALVAIRYADVIATLTAVGSFCIFMIELTSLMGDVYRMILPFIFMCVFGPLYFLARNLRVNVKFRLWYFNLLTLEACCLLLFYAAGNYFVVRELGTEMMGIYLEDGQEIPYAFVFYGLTAILPILYLYFGIVRKDIVLIRVSLIMVAFSAFTFKYYFSLGHPEITLTLAGALLIAVAILLMRYLKTSRSGYTRENILSEKWGDANVQGFVISQTMGGNIIPDTPETAGGGGFGGGGVSDTF